MKGSFQFKLKPTLLTLIMLPVLLGLGTWQVERLKWKTSLIAKIDSRMQETPVDFSTLSLNDDLVYRPVFLNGTYDETHPFYLFSMSAEGDGGYHVLTPLTLQDGRHLLVDRGWISYQQKKEGHFSVPQGGSLKGVLRLPEHHWQTPNNNPAINQWYWIDLKAMEPIAGVPSFLPYVLELSDSADDAPKAGQTRIHIPNNHLEYAFTWYSFAVILLTIFLISSYKKED